MSDTPLTHSDNQEPTAFTQAQLEWLPWLPPLPEDELTDRHYAGLVDAARAKSPYFRLLARDPDTLGARTRSDKDIFYNPDAGLPRAERELSATATSRFNGCIYCASVHARKAAQLSGEVAPVDALLAVAPGADLAAGQSARWAPQITFAAQLAATPSALTVEHLAPLRALGLSELELVDLIGSVAFFSWANRLMLTLGEPYLQS